MCYASENIFKTSRSLEDWSWKLASSFLSPKNLCSDKSKEIPFSEKSWDTQLSEKSWDKLKHYLELVVVFVKKKYLFKHLFEVKQSEPSWDILMSAESFDKLSDSVDTDLWITRK